MHRLTREVRFAITPGASPLPERYVNGHAGYPALERLGYYFSLAVTLQGSPGSPGAYLINITDIDRVVRERVVPLMEAGARDGTFLSYEPMAARIYDRLKSSWPRLTLYAVALRPSPFLSAAVLAQEAPMVRRSQRFEFSASHRLHDPQLSDEDNRRHFGKCNNPFGHGHNYELEVTVRGEPAALPGVVRVEEIVGDAVINPFDHKNLNVELPEFKAMIPSVENIAMVIYQRLRGPLGQKLASVTVWETPKTWCEYSE